jgi:precorrin-6A/cobalt-precorrin-6A reductase
MPTIDSQRESTRAMQHNILILGGTTQARQLAQALAARADLAVTLSLAGRTAAPLAQPVPVRSGGFGGTEGLVDYLRAHRIDAVIDATHPHAAVMSAHACEASTWTAIPLLRLDRPPWHRVAGDRWTEVIDAQAAVRAVGAASQRVFLALGRQQLAAFAAAPQHHYLVRSVDPIEPPLAVPDACYLLSRGPFQEQEELALLRQHSIDVVVAKNSGGAATYGKLAAARALGLRVILLARPPAPPVERVTEVGAALEWLRHVLTAGIERGV